jgi:hypothetical protein
MTTFLHSLSDSLIVKCVAVALLILFWVFGTLWEHKTYRNKQLTGGWLLFLLGVTVFIIFFGPGTWDFPMDHCGGSTRRRIGWH